MAKFRDAEDCAALPVVFTTWHVVVRLPSIGKVQRPAQERRSGRAPASDRMADSQTAVQKETLLRVLLGLLLNCLQTDSSVCHDPTTPGSSRLAT